MSMHMAEALTDSLIAFARAGARGPSEIVLPTRDFLWLANDLGIGVRPVVGRDPRIFAESIGRYGGGSLERTFRVREIWVDESFVFAGPHGPVTIREAKEA